MGPGLHTLQYQILKRAIKLLSPGGRIVYSTCSHNPVENEAIISTMLNKYPELKLVDVSNELPDLRRAPGLLTWKFMDNEGNWYDTYDQLPEKLRSKLPPSLFPNGREKELHLERWYDFSRCKNLPNKFKAFDYCLIIKILELFLLQFLRRIKMTQ